MKKTREKSKGKRNVSVQIKLVAILVPIIMIIMAVMIVSVQQISQNIVKEKSENTLTAQTEKIVNTVEAWKNKITYALQSEKKALVATGMDKQEQKTYIKRTANEYDTFPDGMYYSLTNGEFVHSSFVPEASYDPHQATWYTLGINSDEFVFGAVYVDAMTGENVVSASSAIKDLSGNVIGVAAADIHLDSVSKIVNNVTLESTGGTILIDGGTNMILGHKDPSAVGAVLEELNRPMYNQISKWLAEGALGLRQFTSPDGTQYYLDLQKAESCDWYVVSFVPAAEVLSGLTTLTWLMVTIAVITIIVLLGLIYISLRSIVLKPVKHLNEVAKKIADGDLTASITHISNDEFGTLAVNFNKTAERLHDYVKYIDEISGVLNEVANGNLDYTLTYDYAGEFSKIKTALENISDSFNNTLTQINIASDQVFSGSDQLSSGAQALSQGATEQAATVEELSATITELSEQIQSNADDSRSANNQVEIVSGHIADSNERMQELISAMKNIEESSRQIDRIIKTIEDIAFQTNILALNAAVEAARAGAAGKGFAVVADEVRNLATKSDSAAKNTAALIESSIQAVQNGASLADKTAQALQITVGEIGQVNGSVSNISLASSTQAASIAQVVDGIQQISSVVQTTSATAEETAASSEELSGQAQMLREMVGKFNLKNTDEQSENA